MRKRQEIPIIGENYPVVGDTIYWKDLDGNMHDDIVVDIEKDLDGNIVTNYFISRTENGGGCFIDEESLIEPWSGEVEMYKKKRAQEKAKEISNYISQDDVWEILYNRLRKNYYGAEEASHILEILEDCD